MNDSLENKQDVLDIIKSREIVQEILKYGVSDFQIKKIIKFLSLELEDRDLMISICGLIDPEEIENTQKSKIEI